MTTTPNLALPYLEAGQAQKHVTLNESLRMLDALVMLTVLDRDLSAPPSSPAAGARYIVKAPGSGAFAGKDNRIAHYVDGGWLFHAPQAGWTCFVADEQALLAFDGAEWVAALDVLGGVSELHNLGRLGVGTTADAANPFAAKLNNALWTARGSGEGGDGDLRFKFNKEAAGNTASLLMQTGWSGRAEIGLTGDDDFHFKVSPDGATWFEAILIDRDSGTVSFPNTSLQGGREVLTAHRTYYVRSDGADSNSGLVNSAGGAFLTLQKAVDSAAALDLSIYNVTIQAAAGTYARVELKALTGSGSATILGDTTTPANVHITTSDAGAPAILADGVRRWTIDGVKVSTTGSALQGVRATNGAFITLGRNEYGPSPNAQIWAEAGSTIAISHNYAVTGSAVAHWLALMQGAITCQGKTVTLTGTPAFSSAFAYAARLGVLQLNSNTYSGSATGKRYNVEENSVVFSGVTLPGNAAGTSATGGQYV
jgi:hypothetical protein